MVRERERGLAGRDRRGGCLMARRNFFEKRLLGGALEQVCGLWLRAKPSRMKERPNEKKDKNPKNLEKKDGSTGEREKERRNSI